MSKLIELVEKFNQNQDHPDLTAEQKLLFMEALKHQQHIKEVNEKVEAIKTEIDNKMKEAASIRQEALKSKGSLEAIVKAIEALIGE